MGLLDANAPAGPPPNFFPALNQSNLTIGQLSNQVQSGQLDLMQKRALIDFMQTPQYGQMMNAFVNQALGSGDGTQPSVDVSGAGMAAGPLLTQAMGLAKNGAEISKARADALAATTKARNEQIQTIANAAGGIAAMDGPIDMGKLSALYTQAQGAGAGWLMGPLQAAVQTGDDGQIRAALNNIAQAGTTYLQRAQGGKAAVETALAGPQFNLQVALAKLKAGEVTLEKDVNGQFVFMPKYPNAPAALGGQQTAPPTTSGAPQPAGGPGTYRIDGAGTMTPDQIAAINADAAKSGLQPVSGTPGISTPPAPAAAPSGQSAPPVVTPTGVQGALSPAQQTLKSAGDAIVKPVATAAAESVQLMRILPQLRAEMAQGYTGPIAGSEAGKALLNFAVDRGWLTPQQQGMVGAMRASDGLVAQLLAPMVRGMSPRGSNAALKYIQGVKPGTENSAPVAQQMISAMMADARNAIASYKNLGQYMASNPTDYGLTGWNAPAPQMPPPPGQYSANPPAASLANIGAKWYDDEGHILINRNGRHWEPLSQ